MELDCNVVVSDCLAKEQTRKDLVKQKDAARKAIEGDNFVPTDHTCLDTYMDLACYPAFCCANRQTPDFRELIETLNKKGCVDKINPVHATVAWKHVSQCS